MARFPFGSRIHQCSRKIWLKEEAMRSMFPKGLAAVGLAGLLVVGLAALPAAEDPPRFSEWSAPVNLGPVVNSSSTEAGVFITKDGLSLYFSSYRTGGSGNLDLWVSQRASVDDDWGTPQNLGANINTSSGETTPAISLDGHWLYFASDRAGGNGAQDLYVSRRHNNRDDLGWQPAVNLGSGVNTAANERGPSLFNDDATETTTLYFSSTRSGGVGGEDIYASSLQPDGTFAPPVNVLELNSVSGDSNPAIRRDGLEMFLGSARTGQLGGTDLWVSTRPSTSDPWSTPVNLGAVVNSSVLDFRPAISFDGTALYFHSERSGGYGGYDLYVTTRSKITGRDKR
jgi:hypothetical protein